MPERFIKPVLAIIAISMIIWLVSWEIFIALKKRKGLKVSLGTEIIFFLFYIYVVGVLSLTVIPLPFERFKKSGGETIGEGINITPFINTIKGLLEIFSKHDTPSTEHIFQNIFGNLLLFLPLGIFLPVFSTKYRSMNKVIIFSALCSASIELTQLLLREFGVYRIVDIDDVILNTTGAILGFLIINKFYLRREKKYLNVQ